MTLDRELCVPFDICFCGCFRREHNRPGGACSCPCGAFHFVQRAPEREVLKQLARLVVIEARMVVEGI